MPQKSNSTCSENEKLTYRRIRQAIGFLGMLLPFILFLLSLIPFFQTQSQTSISGYYYTNLREIFTGILCAVGLFLIRYRGFKNASFFKNDNLLTNIAGYMAFGIAFFPTNPENWADKIYTIIPLNLEFLGVIHYFFSAMFFFITALILINIFPLGQNEDHQIKKSVFNENNIYRSCGWLMLVSVLMVPLASYLQIYAYSTFVLEAFALVCFGIAWLTKGRFLGDKGEIGLKVYRERN